MRVQRSGNPDASTHGVPSLPQGRRSLLRGGPGLLLSRVIPVLDSSAAKHMIPNGEIGAPSRGIA